MIRSRLASFTGDWPRLVAPAIVLAVLFLAYYLGRRPSMMYVLLPVALVGGWVLLRRPWLGLLALPVAALCVPFSIGTGTGTSVNAAVLLIAGVLAVWLLGMILRRDVRLAPSAANWPAIALPVAAALAYISGNVYWPHFAAPVSQAAQLGGLAIFILAPAAFLLTANLVRDLRLLKAMVTLFLLIGVVVMAGRLVPPLDKVAGRLIAAGATGSVFWIWLVALPAAIGLFNSDLRGLARLGLLAIAAAAMAIGLANFSWASGWLPPLVALAVIVWLKFPRLGSIAVLPALLVTAVNFRLLFEQVLTSGNQMYSWVTRLAAWEIVLDVTRTNPLLGLGPANYYNYVQLHPIMGYYVRFNSHNQYVDIIAQTGLLGMICFLWLALSIWREGWGARRLAADGFSRGYLAACLGGLAGMLASGMLGDWVLPFVYNIGLAGFRASAIGWMFLGGIVAIRQISGQRQAQ